MVFLLNHHFPMVFLWFSYTKAPPPVPRPAVRRRMALGSGDGDAEAQAEPDIGEVAEGARFGTGGHLGISWRFHGDFMGIWG